MGLAGLFCLCSFASPIEERLCRGAPGDYLILEGGNMITALAIYSIDEKKIVFEEIGVPAKNLKTRPASWRQWVAEKAPGHTSWSLLEIERSSGSVGSCHSLTSRGKAPLSSRDGLIASLIKLPLSPLPSDQRRKIGPPPAPGEPDLRKIWNPPVVFEGKRQDPVQFDVYAATWPHDGSELSGSRILLYFHPLSHFPFPYWIQVEGTHVQASLRTIDSGKQFPSPYTKSNR